MLIVPARHLAPFPNCLVGNEIIQAERSSEMSSVPCATHQWRRLEVCPAGNLRMDSTRHFPEAFSGGVYVCVQVGTLSILPMYKSPHEGKLEMLQFVHVDALKDEICQHIVYIPFCKSLLDTFDWTDGKSTRWW